ncbi:MAG: DUF4390 domain-containing protein [Rhodocyclaceae bacterium]|nr:DUF4390 domain-containing protein [Rhodocyclaceae bacterium]
MTVFSTHCCPGSPDLGARAWLRLAVLLAALWCAPVLAAEVEIRNAALNLEEDGFKLSADFDFELSSRLDEAVSRGVVLYFVAEFELTRSRWYWIDETVLEHRVTYRLSYHALTRQYRLATGALQQNFNTLEDALRVLARLRNVHVADRGALKPGERYDCALRFRLDVSQLPKPFQLNAVASRHWNLASDWTRWTYLYTGDAK